MKQIIKQIRQRRQVIKKRLLSLAFMAAVSLVPIACMQYAKTKRPDVQLICWYQNEKLTDYFEQSARAFEKKTHIPVICKLVSGVEYMEAINEANLKKEGPDVFLIETGDIEKAVCAGLALENDSSGYRKNYPKNSLNFSTYQGKLYGYPLCFQMAYLVYHPEYTDALTDFQAIMDFSNSFEGAEGVEKILEWNAKDILYNYGFIGEAISFGDTADDKNTFLLDVGKLKEHLLFYQRLAQYFSMDMNVYTSEKVQKDFMEKKTVMALVGVDSYRVFAQENIDYRLTAFPALSDTLGSVNLSFNQCMLVSPYSQNKKQAKKLARYLTDNRAETLLETSSYLPAKTISGSETYETIQKAYEQTIAFPKLMDTADYHLRIQLLLNQVWMMKDGVEEKVDAVVQELETMIQRKEK